MSTKTSMPKAKDKTKLTKTTRIGVLYGGLSSEREVSLRSGKNCHEALQRLGFENAVLIDVQRDIFRQLVEQRIELAYIALHGKYGEDGCIQGMLEILDIPYTGCRVTASALTMNKALTKAVLKDAGMPVLNSMVLTKTGSISGNLNFPVMVKPLNEGSSYGMSKVDEPDQLQAALDEAFKYDTEVMVEEYVQGKSLTVGVIRVDGKDVATPILELRPVGKDWYDLEAKYTEGATEFILPAELPENVAQAIRITTLRAHRVTGCRGMSRIDFVTDSANNFYILEINTIPGMTNLSDLPAQAKAMGMEYDQLVECILKTALD